MDMISVVIPTRNDPEVFDAIDSVRNQSIDDYELIVVDASTGSQKESLESFCDSNDLGYIHEDSFTEHEKNRPGARNAGVEKSSGEIVMVMDADCTMKEDCLENLHDYFENHDIVECNVKYVKDGRNCPMDRVVENNGLDYSFLTAGLAFRRQVWDDSNFNEEFSRMREDTAFGFDALDNNYSYTYGEKCTIEHRAGSFSTIQFLKDRLRFVDDPLFFQEYSDHERFEGEVSHFGRVLYPKELVVMAALVGFSAVGMYNAVISIGGITAIMLFLHFMYLKRENSKRKLDFCPFESALLFFLVPITLFVKRYAIWKGALKNRVLVI